MEITMKNTKVSIIMPVYNAAEHLRETMDCLINQTLKEIEIICVDDGSTDESLDILHEYAARDHRIVVLHQKNLYAGVARNTGFDRASGEFVIFLDSDDLFALDLLEKTYLQGKKEKADIVLFDANFFNSKTGESIEKDYLFRKDFVKWKNVFSRRDIPDHIFTITTPCPWTKLYSKKFIVDHKLKFQDLRHSNDVFFVLSSLALAERITYVDEKLVLYRVNQEKNLQHTKALDPTLFLTAYEAVYDLLNEHGIYEEVKRSFIHVVLSGCVYNLDTVHDHEGKKKIYCAIESEEFKKMNLLSYPKEYYLNQGNYNRIRTVPNILKFMKNRDRNSENTGLHILHANQTSDEVFVSVIIPVYNTGKYVKQCLDSIENQTLKNIEIICIDDGSTDESLAILEKEAEEDSRISVYSEKNSGQSVARNGGLKNAIGKYVYFMDSDDILELNALEKLYTQAERSSLDILYFDGVCFYDDIDEASLDQNLDYYKRRQWYSAIYHGIQLMCAMEKNREFRVSPCLQLIRRDFLIKNRLQFEEGLIHEDNLFTFQTMLSADRVSHLQEPLFRRRYRKASTMTQKTSFEHVYGYFKCFLENNGLVGKIQLPDEEKMLVTAWLRRLLCNARDKYLQLDFEERESIRGLELREKMQFELYIVDWFRERRKVLEEKNKVRTAEQRAREAEKRAREAEKKVREVEKKAREAVAAVKNTETFKIGAAIVKVPRKIKQIIVRL